MKKRILFPAIVCAAILTACSSSSNTENGGYTGINNSYTAGAADSSASYQMKSYDSIAEADYNYDYEYSSDEAYDNGSSSVSDTSVGLTALELKKEMLVYSCTMNIDTLDFGTSVDGFKAALDMYGGFIEKENYSDGGSQSGWYSSDTQKWQTYTATVRVPSSNYDDFCAAASELGDLRSKNANVQNVSQEYSDLKTTLEIYEAKEERYISMLADITDDQYAVTIEKELTELQIQIARIKTRMNEIQTDVAYSFVYITIKEVREYQSEPVKTDTFADRLAAVLKETGRGFLSFLEWLLFFIIETAPYLVFLGIFAAAVISVRKALKKRKVKKAEKLFENETSETSDTQQKK